MMGASLRRGINASAKPRVPFRPSLSAAQDAAANHMLGADGVHPNDTGMTYLADCYVNALSAAGKTPAAGTPVTSYGDSWTSRDTYNAPGKRAIQQLVSRLSLGTLTNQAVGGYKIGDQAARAIGTSGTFVAGTPGLVVVPNAGLNDLLLTDTPQQRTASANYLRALFAVLSAAERIEQYAFTAPGGWTTNTADLWSGGSNAQTNVEGNTATYTITTAGTYYLISAGTDGASLIGGKLTVSQGGTTLATLDLNAQATKTGNALISTYGPLSVKVPNVQAGDLTVTYSAAGRTGAWGFLDALVRISPTPPTILAAKPVRTLSAETQKPEFLAYIRGLYDTMATEFGASVVVCDPAPGWTP